MPSLDDPVPLPSNGWGPSLPRGGSPGFKPRLPSLRPSLLKIDAYGAVGNADRKCKAKTNLVSAYGQNLGAYAAKPHLPVLEIGKVWNLAYDIWLLMD